MTTEITTKYNYASAKAQKFTLAAVRVIIDRLLADPENGLYSSIEKLLDEPGKTGRVSWDHCMATQRVMEVDGSDEYGTGELNAMVKGGQLTLPGIGSELIKVLRNANYIIERGRITGVVEKDDR